MRYTAVVAAGLPEGIYNLTIFNVAASFDPAQSPATFASTFTLNVSAGAPEGDHIILITAIYQVIQCHRHHSWSEKSNHRAGCGFSHDPLCSSVLITQVEMAPPV
jgi:hypothetical protein